MALSEEYKLVSKHKFIHTCANCDFSTDVSNLRYHIIEEMVESGNVKLTPSDNIEKEFEKFWNKHAHKKSLWERIKCLLSR